MHPMYCYFAFELCKSKINFGFHKFAKTFMLVWIYLKAKHDYGQLDVDQWNARGTVEENF